MLKPKTWIHVTTFEQFAKACAFLRAYVQTPESRLGVDLETYIPHEAREVANRIFDNDPVPVPVWEGRFWLGKVRLIAVGTCPIHSQIEFRNVQFLFDVVALGEQVITAGLKDILEAAPHIINHNLKYDYGFLRAQFGITLQRFKIGCTMLFNQRLFAGIKTFGHKLNECYRKHIPESLFYQITGKTFDEYDRYKSENQKYDWSTPILEEHHLQYSADDVTGVHWVYEKQMEHLQNWINEKEKYFPPTKSLANIIKLEFALIPTISMAEIRGFPLDFERHRDKVVPFLEAMREARKQTLTAIPEFQIQPEPGTNKVIVKLDYAKVDDASMPAAQLAATIRKVLHQLFKTVNYDVPVIPPEQQERMFQQFLSQTAKSYKGDPRDLAKRKVAEWVTEFKRPVFVNKEGAIDGDEVHIVWRTSTVPQVSKQEIIAAIQHLIPADYMILPYEPINLNSTDQLNRSLMLRFGQPVPSTEAKILKQFAPTDPEVVKAILDYKNAKDLASRYGRSLVSKCTSRGFLHASINQAGNDKEGVSTGRMSISGVALHQIPGRKTMFVCDAFPEGVGASFLFRESFKAPPGLVFVGGDKSQIEPRVTCKVTGDPRYTKAIMEGEDLHGLTAQAVLGLDYVPEKGSFERDYIGKTMNLAISYGIGANALAVFMFQNTDGLVDWTKEEAQENLDRYFQMYPLIRQKMNEVRAYIGAEPAKFGSLAPFKSDNNQGRHVPFGTMIANCGAIRHFTLTPIQESMSDDVLSASYNPTGKRYFWNQFKGRIQDAALGAYNFLIQGHAATLFKYWLLAMDLEFEKLFPDQFLCGMVLFVHDECEVLCPDDPYYVSETKAIMERSTKYVQKTYLDPIPCKVSVGSGKTWAAVH